MHHARNVSCKVGCNFAPTTQKVIAVATLSRGIVIITCILSTLTHSLTHLYLHFQLSEHVLPGKCHLFLQPAFVVGDDLVQIIGWLSTGIGCCCWVDVVSGCDVGSYG